MSLKQTQEAGAVEAWTTQRTRLPLSAFFTGSVTQTGITAFFSVVPMALSAFFGSALVDRWGYKRTSVLGDLASGLTVALIPLLYAMKWATCSLCEAQEIDT